LENLCPNAKFTGLHRDGGCAQYTVVHEEFAYRAFRLSEAAEGERLGLCGFGASAHVVIQVARHLGCEVYVFTRSEEHKRLAAELGAAWVGEARDEPPKKMDRAIIFAPAGELVPEALHVLRPGGRWPSAGSTTTLPGSIRSALRISDPGPSGME